MKTQHLYRAARLVGLLLTGLCLNPRGLQAQWLTHTYTSNNPPSSQSTTAFFPNGTGAYAGNVTVTASNFVDGTGDGYNGIVPTSVGGLTPTFNANFPYNPGNTFDYLNMGSTDTGDTFDVTFNFSGLGGTNQYLPAFTTIALLDVDSLERIGSLTAYDTLGNVITGNWLLPLAPPKDLFDWAGGGITPGQEATYTQSGGIYTFNGMAINDSSAFQGFATQFDIGSIQFHYDHNQAIFGDAPGGYSIAILAPVPEPSATLLAALGGLVAVMVARRRDRAPNGSKPPVVRVCLGLSGFLFMTTLSLQAATYQIDDGTAEFDWGNQDPPGGDLIALNEFAITGGNNLITSIEIAWGNPSNPDPSLNGLQYTAVLWKDGSGVGNPSGAVVLMTIPNQTISGAGTNTFVTSTFNSPVLVPTANFFVGFLITNAAGQRPAALDFSLFNSGQSFAANAPPGQGDIFNLNANPNGVEAFDPTWMIRANAVPEPSTYALLAVGLLFGGHRLLLRRSA